MLCIWVCLYVGAWVCGFVSCGFVSCGYGDSGCVELVRVCMGCRCIEAPLSHSGWAGLDLEYIGLLVYGYGYLSGYLRMGWLRSVGSIKL